MSHSIVAEHPLRPATDRRLGEPLPHQLANRTRAHLRAINLYPKNLMISRDHPVLASLSESYPRLRGRLPTCYSPVRR